jgi:hypothetical protein
MQQGHCQNRTKCVINWNCIRIRVFRDVTLSLGELFPTFRRILEDEGITALWNIGNCPSKNTAPYPSKPECSAALLWQPRMVLWSHKRREALMSSKYMCILWNRVRGNVTNPIPIARQPIVGQGLLVIEASRSHSVTPHTVGILWMSDQLVAETSTWRDTTFTLGFMPPRRDSSPQPQQASSRRPTP